MTIENVRDALPDYARDLKLNLGTVLTPQGAPGLNEKQIWSIVIWLLLSTDFAWRLAQAALSVSSPCFQLQGHSSSVCSASSTRSTSSGLRPTDRSVTYTNRITPSGSTM